ncbi:unnamed protein product [Ectocarpus sp. CCAP 1310/34]|nr:unnamed protein product [Ectocarpus sp. CCAP 1310/34]
MGGYCLETGWWWRIDFSADVRARLRNRVCKRDDLSMNVFELLGMVMTAWALTVHAGDRPEYPGQSVLMRGDNMSAVHWVNKCRGAKEPRSGALMRMMGCLEMRNEWRFRAKHIKGLANTLANGISRWKHDEITAKLRSYRPDICWQEQHLGQEALDLTSAVLDSSSSDDQLQSRLNAVTRQVEIDTSSPLIKCALRGVARSHVDLGRRRRVRLPVTWSMLRDSEGIIPSWGLAGRVTWLCLSLSYFFITRSDEMFANSSGVVHPVHCLTRRDVAFFRGSRQLEYMHWQQADRVEIRFRGHKGDQGQIGDVRARTRDEVHGPRSGYRANGGAVALMVASLSCHATLPDSAPLSSYRSGQEVKVLKYDQALRALREIVERSGRNPKDFALHSLRIGGASTLAAGGAVSERVIQREGRWKSDAYKVYTVNNSEDSQRVSRTLGDKDKGVARQPGENTMWGGQKRRRISHK